MSPTGQVVDSSLAETLLDRFTPVDRSVFAELDELIVAMHVEDLIKRLCAAVEMTAPGAGSDTVTAVLAAGLEPDETLRELDALLEFGARWDDLDDAQRQQASRAEIRQEIQHFDRIMDLETLTSGRRLKRRRGYAIDAGVLGAAERTLVLVHERMALRGAASDGWADLSDTPQRNVLRVGAGAELRRTTEPYVFAVAVTDDADAATEALLRFEEYALRHPLAVAVALLDVDWYLQRRASLDLAAARLEFDADGRARAHVRFAGAGSALIVDRDGFTSRVRESICATARPLGDDGAAYLHLDLALSPTTSLVLALDGGALADAPDVDGRLNATNRSGRVVLRDNLRSVLGDHPFAIAKDTAARRTAARGRRSDGTPTPADIAAHLADGARAVELAIECGHVHSDREVGPAQLRGLALGGEIVGRVRGEAARRGIALIARVTPMVDDDHVLNRLSYGRYAELFERQALPVDDLIMESSPIVRAVAHDMLRRAVARDGDGYRLECVGGNLYLTADGLRVELIEDLENEMRNGCVLFETALLAYRCATTAMTAAFWERIGGEPFDVHAAMARDYDAAGGPEEREDVRARHNDVYVDPWEQVQASLDDTPFLDAFQRVRAAADRERRRLFALNVLENYYAPQQRKVLQLAELIGVGLPLFTVFFSPHGHGLSLLDAIGGPR